MKQEWIDIMKSKRRLKLDYFQFLTHYFIVLFLLLDPIMTGIELIKIYFIDNYISVLPVKEQITDSLPYLILAIVLAYLQYRRLCFKEIKISYTDHQFQEAVKRTVDELEWKIDNNQKGFFRARRPWNWSGSWGEIITIIKEEDGMLINSIGDPNKKSSVFTFGWNKKNIKTFLKNLNDTIQNIPAKARTEEIDYKKEWTFKKIIIRLLLYPLCLFLISISIFLTIESMEIKAFIIGIPICIIATVYLYSDLKIILTKKNK